MKAIILAAGYATRLYPLTINKPKALLDIRGKAIIEHVIEKIPLEIKDILIVTNSKFFPQFVNWLNNYRNYKDFDIKLFDDGTNTNENRLGAIGDMVFVLRYIQNDDILAIAADNLFDFSLQDAYNFFRKIKKDVVVLYNLKSREKARNFGVVKIDTKNRIIKFEEKPQEPETTLVSTGIYFFKKNTIKLLSRYMHDGNSKEGPGFFVKWLFSQQEVYGFLAKREWYDIGNLDTYNEARRNFGKEK